MSKQTLSAKEVKEAKSLYKEFWKINPNMKNPSDINNQAKADFLAKKGFESICLMQKARKQKYSFTKLNKSIET